MNVLANSSISPVCFPVKLNDDYSCQGRDRDGEYVVFDDLLNEGDLVASVVDAAGNTWGPHGFVVRRADGLWVERETS
jgi:hypothetical protein